MTSRLSSYNTFRDEILTKVKIQGKTYTFPTRLEDGTKKNERTDHYLLEVREREKTTNGTGTTETVQNTYRELR